MKYATGPHDLLSMAEILQLSGLDFMQGILEGRLPAPPISKAMGFNLHVAEQGRVVFRGAPAFEMTNPSGTVHGGWYGTVLDSSMACAVMTRLPRGTFYTTLEYKINITRPIPIGMLVDCTGEVDHSGRSTAVAHGEIRGVEDGKLYATGTTTCLVMNLSER